MKPILFLLATLCTLCFFSCTTQNSADAFIGQWQSNDNRYGYFEINIKKSENKTFIIDLMNNNQNVYWGGIYELKENGTLVKPGIGGWSFMVEGTQLKSTTIEGGFTVWTRKQNK